MALRLAKRETLELRLGEILKERGISQSDFAERVGVHRQQINLWVSKPSRIDFDTLARLARALDVPVEELLKAVPARRATKAEEA